MAVVKSAAFGGVLKMKPKLIILCDNPEYDYNYRAKEHEDGTGDYVYGVSAILDNTGGECVTLESRSGDSFGLGYTNSLEKFIGYDLQGNEVWHKVKIDVYATLVETEEDEQ